MNKRTLGILVSLLIIGSVSAAVFVANAETQAASDQGIPLEMTNVMYEYSAKFVCGDGAQSQEAVVPGKYMTGINVRNPQTLNLSIMKQVVIAQSEDMPQLAPLQPMRYLVQKGRAFEIDCKDIAVLGKIPTTMPFYKGFVVLQSPKQLDVVGVYTSMGMTAAGATGAITLDVEKIHPKVILPSTSSTIVDLPVE